MGAAYARARWVGQADPVEPHALRLPDQGSTLSSRFVADDGSSAQPSSFWASLRTARSAAIGGLVFAVLIALALYLLRQAFPTDGPIVSGAPPSESAMSQARISLTLLPYAGIAFLWFMAALFYNLGHSEHRLFTTVFLGSGIVFVALLFVAGALAAGEINALSSGFELSEQMRATPGFTINELLTNYAARMAAVFCLSLSAFGRATKLMPKWLSILGTITGLFLLLIPLGVPYVVYVFPTWVAILSIYLIAADPGGKWREAEVPGT